jgi:hypothetical protein
MWLKVDRRLYSLFVSLRDGSEPKMFLWDPSLEGIMNS